MATRLNEKSERVRMTVDLPAELHEAVLQKANEEDLPMSQWVRRVLRKATRELPT